MDHPAIHRTSLPQSWSQPYPQSAPPNYNPPRPFHAHYPPQDNNPYTAPQLYPTAVSQQIPQSHIQPLPSTLIPGGPSARPRARTSTTGPNLYIGPPPPVPQFPSPVAPHFPQAHPFPHIPIPPAKPPGLQSGHPRSTTQDVPPIRPSPASARRSSSSSAVGRIPQPEVPPPIPPLPPSYQSGSSQPPRHSPAPPPPSIPIPSPSHSYRSDSSPLYESPYEASSSPLSAPPPPISPPPQFPANSPPKFEPDVKRAPVDEEEEALALAIALSAKESKERSGEATQEEEDIMKAIEESLRHASSFGIPSPSSNAGPSTLPKTASPVSFPSQLPVSESPVSPQATLPPSPAPHLSASLPVSKVPSPLILPAKSRFEDDAALAQQLAEEEEERMAAGPSNPKPASPLPPSPRPETVTPPAPASSTASRKRQEAQQHKFSVTNADSDLPPPMYHHVVPANTPVPAKTSPTLPYHHVVSANTPVPAKTSPTLLAHHPALGRSTSASAVIHSSSSPSPISGQSEKLRASRHQTFDGATPTSSVAGPNHPAQANPSPLPTVGESWDAPPAQSPSSSTEPVTPNSFIDQQLLYGVSLGFNPPQISSIKTTLKGGVPNVISLPAGRFVPFHIQAPDWRHLLKMMARLSGSRIEASVEALAGSKQELKLRTIIQFVKVNAASQDWRTVIYLTIDSTPPTTAPHKFTNGDVNILPYTYTLGPIPTLLRDNPDSPMSKYYTIPSTPNTPYPTLPISFPNMAMYLASAVEDSRRMGHDNSSGMKRLAKTLVMLYPAEVELGMEDDEPDKPPGGVVNMFRNVFGRGRRDQRRNDDNYADLVTPFVPEWG